MFQNIRKQIDNMNTLSYNLICVGLQLSSLAMAIAAYFLIRSMRTNTYDFLIQMRIDEIAYVGIMIFCEFVFAGLFLNYFVKKNES